MSMAWQRNSSSGYEDRSFRIRSRGESDVEKEAIRIHDANDDDSNDNDDDDSEPFSANSSRNVSSVHKPMLTRAYSTNAKSSYLIRFPNSIMRWLCWGVAATIIIFIFALARASHRANEEIRIAKQKLEETPKPHIWETFPFLWRYYGGIRTLVPTTANVPEYPKSEDETPSNLTVLDSKSGSEPGTLNYKRAIQQSIKFDPYPDYISSAYIAKYGEKVDCFLNEQNTIVVPKVRVYEGIPKGFPDAVLGSAALLGMRTDICYDRFGRLGPYGLGYSLNRGGSGAQQEGEREGAELVWEETPEVDFRRVKWADVQRRCATANKHRFASLSEPQIKRFQSMQIGNVAKREEELPEVSSKASATKKSGTEKLPRTAVIIRTWADYSYTAEDSIYLRSIISELNVLSGGEYNVHFLIHVKDNELPIWSDDETYKRVLRDALPEEFHGMGTLWSERQMLLMYGGLEESMMRGLPVHGVYRSTFMPMQYFAYQHPEYDYFWNWEMDLRTTNHWYHLFDSVGKWAKQQPRKLLWERNSRFYVPAKHGTWDDFSHMVRIQTEQGTNSANNLWSSLSRPGSKPGGTTPGAMRQAGDKPIWGPERPLDDKVDFPDDPIPPTSFEKDKYVWGVGEDADLITFNPLFDPEHTTWLLADDTTGYNITRGRPPRRTAIITASRLSYKLLHAMHRETTINHHTMFSEMWPASAALHHGLKAVYAPHAEYIDRKWPIEYLEAIFNGGRNGATGGARTCVFGDREHNLAGTTWYYRTGFPEVLWHRWLGMKFHNDGGEQEELAGEGRMCLPGMLLHPIKRVELVQEGKKADP